MAVTKISNLGEITTNFLLNDFTVYLMNTSATGGYVSTDFEILGFTGAEKTLNRNNEKFRRETKIPRVEIFTKTIRKNLEVTFDLYNFNEDLIKLMTQGTKVDLGTATGTQISHGTVESTLEYRTIRLATTLEDSRKYIIDIPKSEISFSGEQTVGGEENVGLNTSIRAVYNPNTNGTGNLYQELFLASTFNATAQPPVGY